MDDARCFATAIYDTTARSALAAAGMGARLLVVYQAAAVLTHGPD